MNIQLKHTLLIIIAIMLLVGTGIYFKYTGEETKEYTGKGLWDDYTLETKNLEGTTYRLVVAETPEQWSQGLMYVRKPVTAFDGMIFTFPDKQPRTFWNQNTFEKLKLYWISDGKIIGTSILPSIEDSKKIEVVESPGPADTVVEIIL